MWELEKSYLSIYYRNETARPPVELLGVHCDPAERGDSTKARLKRLMHMHISCAGSPLDAAHIPLNDRVFPPDTESLDRLDNAWEAVLRVLKAEVLSLGFPAIYPRRVRHLPDCLCTCERA